MDDRLVQQRIVRWRIIGISTGTMEPVHIIQILVALTIFNVWLLRFRRPTRWRGGDAKTMPEEFAAYGLPPWSVSLVGTLKVSLAVLLIVGVWVPVVTVPAAAGLGLLMLAAALAHFKIKDPLVKALPALTVLLLCAVVVFYSVGQR